MIKDDLINLLSKTNNPSMFRLLSKNIMHLDTAYSLRENSVSIDMLCTPNLTVETYYEILTLQKYNSELKTEDQICLVSNPMYKITRTHLDNTESSIFLSQDEYKLMTELKLQKNED